MALHRLGDEDLADEVAQETLARALAAKREGGDVVRNLGAFVHGIARHVIADLLRARGRDAGAGPLADAADGTSVDPLSSAVTTEEHARVRGALESLQPADRQLLRLSFYDGLGPAEIAARLGEPADRVRKRKSRALERLRQAFLGHDGAARPTENGAAGLAAPGEAR